MKEESKKLLKKTINIWLGQKYYTYQQKEVLAGKSPLNEGEFVLKFKNTLHGFICKGENIPISLTSKTFHTTTLSNFSTLDNKNIDNHRLEKLLKDFDEEFNNYVEDKINQCEDVVYTTDPLFF